VAASALRRGFGRRLVAAVLDEARQRQMHNVVAGIVSDNIASLTLHRSLGFVDVGCVRQVGYKFGRWLDLSSSSCCSTRR